MNNTTRKHPRTLQEAFGPYTSHNLDPMPRGLQRESRDRFWQDLALVITTAIGLLVLFHVI